LRRIFDEIIFIEGRMPSISRLAGFFAVSSALLGSATARAEDPRAEDFAVEYWVTEPGGAPVRAMKPDDLDRFVNRARCECGHRVDARVVADLDTPVDEGVQVDAFVGVDCDAAESDPDAPFGRCGVLASVPVTEFVNGVETSFHPVFLAHGVAASSTLRDVALADTVVSGGCDGVGEAGVWVCAETNGAAGCQPEEFLIDGDTNANSDEPSGLAYDFEPPAVAATDLVVEPGGGSVLVSWEIDDPGEIAGFRVLCEEAATGQPIDGVVVALPEPTASGDGEHYFNARNLCGDQPFSSVMFSEPDGPGGGSCGDGRLDEGEQCDDGEANADDGLCSTACALRVGAGLHALDWDHLCSDHIPASERSVIVGHLKDGRAYNFVLVAHDAHGNPRALARVVSATPDAALPSFALAEDGCGCSSTGGHVPRTMLMLVVLGLLRRRRARR
jgi:MYXO-CTERM domain-containing protein